MIIFSQELLLLEELLSKPSQRRMDTKKLKTTKVNQVKKIKAAVEHYKLWKQLELNLLMRATRPLQATPADIAAAEAAIAAAESEAFGSWKEKLPWHQNENEGIHSAPSQDPSGCCTVGESYIC